MVAQLVPIPGPVMLLQKEAFHNAMFPRWEPNWQATSATA